MQENCPKTKKEMATVQNVMLRLSIVLGMVAAVVTILYFTPVPDQNFKSCDRPCHELDWPMICRIKLTIEMYQNSRGMCDGCPSENGTDCESICTGGGGGGGGTQELMVVNRRVPGPVIQVCQNDVLVVDVVNKVAGHSLTVHWRGQSQDETPFMDGVPMVTQCPITSFTTFQYKLRATSAGTHLYHAHADSDRTNGLFGALIVRQPDKVEPHRKSYDFDMEQHVVMISEWADYFGGPTLFLINGKTPSGNAQSLHAFKVKKGKRYRFRVAYTGGNSACPLTFAIDQHLLKVIALDGNPTKPYEVKSVGFGKGERFDFVLKTHQAVSNYFMRVESKCNNVTARGLALITYENAHVNNVQKADQVSENVRNFNTAMCDSRIGEICLKGVRAMEKMPSDLREAEIKRTIYLVLNSKIIARNEGDSPSVVYTTNNLTFTYPSSPLLTQLDDVPTNVVCDELNLPEKCAGKKLCECVHVEYIPLGSATELFFIDQGGDEEEQVFHMHGHKFYIVGSKQFGQPPTVDEAKQLASRNGFRTNLNNPVLKDTVRIPRHGVVAVRFLANNPGFWILRDEKSKGWTRGYDVLFQVGQLSDMASTPSNFPTCGSFIGPDFFLM